MLALVIPKSLTFSEKWKPVREFILDKMRILELIDLSKAFEDVLLEQIVLILRKEKVNSEYTFKGTNLFASGEMSHYDVPLSICKESDTFLIHIDEPSLRIYNKINGSSKKLGEIIEHFRGLPLQSKLTQNKNEEPTYRGDDIKRYYAFNPNSFLKKKDIDYENDKIKLLLQPKIVSQRILAHVTKPIDHIIIMASYDTKGILNVDTVENTIIIDKNFIYAYLLCLLNSRLIAWLVYKFIFNKAVRTMDFDKYYVSKIPVKGISKEEQRKFEEYANKMNKLIGSYIEIDASFDRFFSLEAQFDTIRLSSLFRELDVKDKQVFDNRSIGKVERIEAKFDDGWVTINVEYEPKEGNNKKKIRQDVCRFNLHDDILSRFTELCINNYQKSLGSGNLLEKILSIEIPRYDKNEKKNIAKIESQLEPYLKAVSKKKKLYDSILELNSAIDKEIYEIFGLSGDEISFIESETPMEVYIPEKR